MKIIKTLKTTCLILILGLMAIPSLAQQEEMATAVEATPPNSIELIIEHEEAIDSYEIPNDILKNLITNPSNLKRPSTGVKKPATKPAVKVQPNLTKVQGFRVQVFSDGRDPSTLQSRARARGNAIVARFPKYRGQVYSFSSSPNWYTRVGNFETQKEAAAALAELKRAFPAFAAEMRVVKSPITVIK